jgi:diaminopimelate decarboxylase
MDIQQDIQKKIFDVMASGETPGSFYLYDTRPMTAKLEELKQKLPPSVQIYYAMKANGHEAFLKAALKAQVKGIEIASMGEGALAINAGFTFDQLIFTGPGKTPEELWWSVENGLDKIHIESLVEAHRLNQICADLGVTQDILVRVNPNFDIHGAQAKFSGDSSKFGIDENLFMDLLPDILALENLNFKGLHVYAASGVLQVEDLLENCRRVFTLARDIEAAHDGLRCDIIDFGGGFGIDYLESGADFSVDIYAIQLHKLIEKFGFEDRQFVIELGRYLTADSGWYCTEILDIKTSLGKKQIITRGGVHHFRRPVALGINHPLTILSTNTEKVFNDQESVEDDMVFIGGPLCNSVDKLAPKDIYVKKANVGDIAVLGLAGAYGLSMSHVNFLCHPHPPEIVL